LELEHLHLASQADLIQYKFSPHQELGHDQAELQKSKSMSSAGVREAVVDALRTTTQVVAGERVET
jgi:hypothetical protein